jgi:general nucleoside transport system permease protein
MNNKFILKFKEILETLAIPILAIFTAFLVASVVIFLSGSNPLSAYSAMLAGAFGDLDGIVETLNKTAPLLIAGLGAALAFRGGLFNIGIEGQIMVGSIGAVLVGSTIKAPPIISIPLTLLGGVFAGGLWGAIPGLLKARFEAHEVITTIMANYIAARVITWALGAQGPLRKVTSVVPETNSVQVNAQLPILISNTRLHAGLLIAIGLVIIIYILLFRTSLGFEIRSVGMNLNASRYAGMKVERNIILTMALSGGLAGLAGAIQVMGLPPFNFSAGFNTGYGFDSIAVAVLGATTPIGVAFSSLLFGFMSAGARLMQLRAKVPIEIISILQGLILMFVAANQIIRKIYHIRAKGKQDLVNLGQGWAGGKE